MSHKDLIFSPEFAAYRKVLVRVGVLTIKAKLLRAEPGELQGALDMLRKIIRVPAGMVKDKNLVQELDMLLKEDFNRVCVELVRGKDE